MFELVINIPVTFTWKQSTFFRLAVEQKLGKIISLHVHYLIATVNIACNFAMGEHLTFANAKHAIKSFKYSETTPYIFTRFFFVMF